MILTHKKNQSAINPAEIIKVITAPVICEFFNAETATKTDIAITNPHKAVAITNLIISGTFFDSIALPSASTNIPYNSSKIISITHHHQQICD